MPTNIDWTTLADKVPQIIDALAKVVTTGSTSDKAFLLVGVLVIAGLIAAALFSNSANTPRIAKFGLIVGGLVAIVTMAGWGLASANPPAFNVGDELTFYDDEYKTAEGVTTKKGFLVRTSGGSWLECAEDPAKRNRLELHRFKEFGASASSAFLVRDSRDPDDCRAKGVILQLDFVGNTIKHRCIGDRDFQTYYKFKSYKRAEGSNQVEWTSCNRPVNATVVREFASR